MEKTITLALANTVLNNPLLPNGVRETSKRGKRFAILKQTMCNRRLADVYVFAHLSFKLLLPLDSLPLVGQGIGIWYNNRSGHWRTGGTMMANGEIATPLVLREVASIGEGPCTPRTGNRHIWRTSFWYLADLVKGPLWDLCGISVRLTSLRYLADVAKGPLWDVCGMSGRRLFDV